MSDKSRAFGGEAGGPVEVLEGLVDKYGLAAVLHSLGEVCYLKADHLRANWQDKSAARVWEMRGRKMDRAGDDCFDNC